MLKQNCHLACPGPPWNRSVALWRDLRCGGTGSQRFCRGSALTCCFSCGTQHPLHPFPEPCKTIWALAKKLTSARRLALFNDGRMSAYLRPIVHQVSYVHTAEAGSEVPAFSRGIRFDRIQIRRRQYSVPARRRIVTVNGTAARNNIISNSDIMENAARRHAVSSRRIAVVQIILIGVGRASVFSLRQLVKDRIGVTLRASRLLIDQGLDTGKLGSRKGSTTSAVISRCLCRSCNRKELRPGPRSDMQNRIKCCQNPFEANKETSGKSRLPSLGMPKIPVCHEGLEYTKLGAPLPPTMLRKFAPIVLLQNATLLLYP